MAVDGDKEIHIIYQLAVVVFISIIALILLFSVDIGSLHEVTQHPEYFYASETVGLSMYPQVYTGDIFIIQTRDHPDFDIKLGDIIVFDSGHSYVGHRVLEIHDGYYITKGDNNHVGERVYDSQIVGRVYKTVYRTNPIGQFVFTQVLQ